PGRTRGLGGAGTGGACAGRRRAGHCGRCRGRGGGRAGAALRRDRKGHGVSGRVESMGGGARQAPPPHGWERTMSRQTKEEILLKVQAAQHLASEAPEQAELFLRSALKDCAALGQSSASLHLQLAELLYRLRRTRQALEQVMEVLELDPF